MADSSRTRETAIIVGAGPIGLACALSAKRRGLDPLVVDAGAIVHSIVRYPVGMRFFTTPELLEIGGHPFPCAGEKPTREEALKYYRGIVRSEGIRVRPYCRLREAKRVDDGIRCELLEDRGPLVLTCDRLVLATGYFDGPNLLDVPGEDLPHVSHYYDEGHRSFGRDVVVVGGGNSAAEAALDLFRAGARVTVVHRRAELKPSVKYWLRPDVENRIRAGEIAARFETGIVRIEPKQIVVRGPAGSEEMLPADRVYLLKVSEIFIENGRFDGEKVFADSRAR